MMYNYKDWKELCNKPAGYRIMIKGVGWIKMQDDNSSHINGCYFNSNTGTWKHTSKLFDYKGKE